MPRFWSAPINRLPPGKRTQATRLEMEAAIGSRFGSRTVLNIEPYKPYDNGVRILQIPRVRVRCDCGAEAVINWSALKAGVSKSCPKCYHKNLKGNV